MRTLIFLLMILTLVGCGTPNSTSGPTPGKGAEHSDHEGEHGAEETPSATHTGEGSEEHGEHEGHGEEEESEEGFVTLTDLQKKEIGLAVSALKEAKGVTGGLRTGRVEADPDRKVVVSPQVSGTIKHLPLIVGSRVRKGEMLVMLDSPEVTELKGEYRTAEVEVDLATKELSNKRQLIMVGDESRRGVEEASLEVAKAQASTDGVAARLESAKMTYQRLEKLRSEGIASSQQVEEARATRKALEADLREAKSSVTIAAKHLEREKRVSGSQLREKAETFPAEASLDRARETVRHTAEQLRQLGADPNEQAGTVSLYSSIDGQVLERPVTRGQMVSPGDTIAVLIDPSEVWVWIDLVRADLASVQVGDEVTVSLTSDPKVTASGEISYIDARVDSESQTVRAKVSLREPGGKFRVGSFVNASIGGESTGGTTLPQAAIVEVEGQKVVYRVDAKGYRRTVVEVVGENGDAVNVTGLPTGSQVVVKGASDLKSIDLSSSIGGHSH